MAFHLVSSAWLDILKLSTACHDPNDLWQSQDSNLRHFLKGWGPNQGGDFKLKKGVIMSKIQELDTIADTKGLSDEGWLFCYYLEDQRIHIF
jgi:hypothetical protein